MLRTVTLSTDGEWTDVRRVVCCSDAFVCACSTCEAVIVAVYVYCVSAAYCDSKFGNASADCDGEAYSSDPGTVGSAEVDGE